MRMRESEVNEKRKKMYLFSCPFDLDKSFAKK